MTLLEIVMTTHLINEGFVILFGERILLNNNKKFRILKSIFMHDITKNEHCKDTQITVM